MKHTKKLFAIALTLIMALALTVPAFAQTSTYAGDDAGVASITVSNAAKSETYSVYKLFDATVGANGEINYTSTADIPAGLTTYFTKDTAGNISATAAATTTVGEGDEAVTSMSTALVDALKSWAGTATAITSAVSDGSALTFANLPYGYYVVTSTQANGAVITVDSTNPVATVYDKNSSTATLSKAVDDINVNIGQTVTYTVTATTTNYDGAGVEAEPISNYTFVDTLPEFLSNVTVTSIIVDNDADATTTADQVNVTAQFDDNKTIVVDWYDEENSAFRYNNGAVVTITYTAVVTDAAAIATEDGNVNTVTMTWDGDGTNDELTASVAIWTYAFALKKVNTEGVALAGATFELPFYVQETADTDGAYIYAGTTAGTGLTNTLVTPESGEILIKGVAHTDESIEADTATQYAITETIAPNGYNKLTEDVIVEVTASTATSTDATVYLDENGAESATETDVAVTYTATIAADLEVVVNNAGVELPSTGGIGTTIFYVVGALLMAGAGVLLVTKKRMADEE